jgi:curli biogenesis system outer membrane secretion channel CsgG
MKKLLFALLSLAVLTACSTMVPVEVMKPAQINMGNMKTIAILNFGYPELGWGDPTVDVLIRNMIGRYLGRSFNRNSVQEQAARYATDRLISLLADTNYFTIMDPSNVEGAIIRANKLTLSPTELGAVLGADAILAGSISYLNTNVDTDRYQTKDSRGNVKFVTTYKKTAEMRVTYRILDAKTGRVVAVRQLQGDTMDNASEYDQLPEDRAMYQRIADDILADVPHQLVPYKVTEYRALMADETKDEEMKKLDELTKKKFYKDALDGYLAIWKNKQNPAAGYNAAIMREITGDVDGAIALMSEVADATKNEKALKEVERLKKTKAESEAAASQM